MVLLLQCVKILAFMVIICNAQFVLRRVDWSAQKQHIKKTRVFTMKIAS